MKIGIVMSSDVARSGRLDAEFHLEPTKQIDAEIERLCRRIERDQKTVLRLRKKREQVLAAHYAIHPDKKGHEGQ